MPENTVRFELLEEAQKRKLCPIPEPKRPWRDWSWYSLFLPVTISGMGVMCFAILAYSFTELRTALASGLSTQLVICGAIAMAIGGEFGTGFTILEIFRKHTKGEATRWDWCGLLISFVASTMSLFLSWAWLSGIMATWTGWTQDYGPLVLGIAGVADFYAGWMEAGMYKGTYEKRHDAWMEEHYIPWREWVAGESGWGRRIDEPANITRAVERTPTQHLPPAVTRWNGNGQYDDFISENGNGTCTVHCPCGWTGKSTGPYKSRAGAASAVHRHLQSCNAAMTAEYPQEDRVEEENGDF